jgi:hypothetical protein
MEIFGGSGVGSGEGEVGRLKRGSGRDALIMTFCYAPHYSLINIIAFVNILKSFFFLALDYFTSLEIT